MAKTYGHPAETNQKMTDLVNRIQIDYRFIYDGGDFRSFINDDLRPEDDVLDVGKSSRDHFDKIKEKVGKIRTLDINQYEGYPDILFDLCETAPEELSEKFDAIICLAVLEHCYDPFKAAGNLLKMIRPGGKIYGFAPHLYPYHAPPDLYFQDYYRFSKDGLAYMFRDAAEVTLFPVRGRVSTPLFLLLPNIWKKYFERFGADQLVDRLVARDRNAKICSGYNFVAIK